MSYPTAYREYPYAHVDKELDFWPYGNAVFPPPHPDTEDAYLGLLRLQDGYGVRDHGTLTVKSPVHAPAAKKRPASARLPRAARSAKQRASAPRRKTTVSSLSTADAHVIADFLDMNPQERFEGCIQALINLTANQTGTKGLFELDLRILSVGKIQKWMDKDTRDNLRLVEKPEREAILNILHLYGFTSETLYVMLARELYEHYRPKEVAESPKTSETAAYLMYVLQDKFTDEQLTPILPFIVSG